MIPAAEALQLPGAQLTEEQLQKLDALDAHIEKAVRAEKAVHNGVVVGMGYRGVAGIRTLERDLDVIAAMDFRLKRLGWKPEWLAVQSQLNKKAIECFMLNLDAEDHARAEAETKSCIAVA